MRPTTHTLFPYTTLFRSRQVHRQREGKRSGESRGGAGTGEAAPGDGEARAGPAPARLRSPSAAVLQRSGLDRKSTRLNSSHLGISYAVFCLKKKNKRHTT